ncbi:leucine-rich repeat receptor protein kinase EMS1-like [Jatropha curcas]|uniref:leucine-rich repeat receptor protein kinase EMS1-like n=1 Tax=Jatropha curcas TaxID=180498 RepID=UPI001893EEF6|nr:leucine-rich repeat receptor protein kinase EMS1-like [Jatropha curcas]
MSRKLSVMAILIPILTFLLHRKLVYGASPVCRPGRYNSNCQCPEYNLNCKMGKSEIECDGNQTLPCYELDAIRTFINRFPSTSYFDALHCQNSSNLEPGAEIRCDCMFKDTKSNITCHITEINIKSTLSGPIDDAISRLQYLQILDLSGHQLTGTLPKSLGNLTNLKNLDLSNNQLDGTIPSSFQHLKLLEELRLSNNYLDGPITSLGNLQNLNTLDLSFNFFNQQIPASFGNLSLLQYL